MIKAEVEAAADPHSRPGNKNASKEKNAVDISIRFSKTDKADRSKGGDSTTYLLSRIKRDFPEHADRVISGGEPAYKVAVELGIKPTHAAKMKRVS